jgi:hypothetical protein
MEKVYRYPSRDLPQVYWHLQDCAARFGYELHRQAGAPAAGAPKGATFAIVHSATRRERGQIRVVESQFGALITLTAWLEDQQEHPGAEAPSVTDLADHLFECVALPPEKRARRWPR